MKNLKNFIILFSIVGLFACKDNTAEVVTEPNYCIPTSVSIEGSELFIYDYTADNKSLSSINILLDEEVYSAKFTADKDGKLTGVQLPDEETMTFQYDGGKITKVEIKEGNEVIGEKVISYSGANISKMEEFGIQEGKKVLNQTFSFQYDAQNNVKKILLKVPELYKNEFVFFEGLNYDNSKLSEFAGTPKFNQINFIVNTEIFYFLPSSFLGNLLSKNACTSGKFNFSLIELVFTVAFGGLSEDETLVALTPLDFKNTIKANEKSFANSTSTTFKTEDGDQTLNFSTVFICN
jgi:hypothetical protein